MLIFYDEYFSSVQRILLEMNGYVASLSSVLQTKKFFFSRPPLSLHRILKIVFLNQELFIAATAFN